MGLEPQYEQIIHIVAIPYPAQGHIGPLMQLCEKLNEDDKFLITFVNTEHNHTRLIQSQMSGGYTHNISTNNNKSNNIILVSIPGGVAPELHGQSDQNLISAFQASEAIADQFLDLLHELNSNGGPKVSCILSDVMMSWTQVSADLIHVPRLAFWTSSAAVFYVIWHMFDLISDGISTFKERRICDERNNDNIELVSCIPGLPPMDLNDLPIIVRSEPQDFIYQFLSRQIMPICHATALLFNTFETLEHDSLTQLGTTFASRNLIMPIHAIGPLLPLKVIANDDGSVAHKQSSVGIFDEDANCLHWLDTQADKSVVYISFGSIFRMDDFQFIELVAGLEASGQAFLWSIRPDFVPGGYMDKLPISFTQSTSQRGLLTTWVPQLDVLKHRAIGAFLTHCGWNSTIESIAMGVPMLCWPDVGERRTNGRLVVSVWKAGLEFTRVGTGEVERKEVERVIRLLMEDTHTSKVLRSNAFGLHQAARVAMSKGGSSSHEWESLLQIFKRL